MPLTANVSIDLKALRHNLNEVKRLVPAAKVLTAIKADAYGHGILHAAKALQETDGFAVAHIAEARRLREAGIDKRILVMSGMPDGDDLAYCGQQQIDLVLHTQSMVDLIQQTPLPSPLNIWFKHDSGMHRLGLDDLAMQQSVLALSDSDKLAQRFYMTHFSASDAEDNTRTVEQIKRFRSAIDTLPQAPCSLANSAAIIKGNLGDSDWVRPGIMLYGANPLPPPLFETYPVDLQPVMTLSAPVIAIRHIAAGESVGYNSRWTASRDSVVATIGIGYGDGYPRHAPDGTPVLINGQRAPLAGLVSMDMLGVDITNCRDIHIGDKAILWGKGLPAEEIANRAGTITYELFTSVTARVRREYLD